MSELTLMDLLESRENRAARQKQLLELYGGVLISFTLNIPGPVKDSPSCRGALYEGMAQLKEQLAGIGGVSLFYEQIRLLPTGPEGYLCVGPVGEKTGKAVEDVALEVKRAAVAVEEGSSLGRLFDIDVLTSNGGISRSRLGAGPRTCLLCGENAKVCARGRIHSMKELLAEVDRILENAGLSTEGRGR